MKRSTKVNLELDDAYMIVRKVSNKFKQQTCISNVKRLINLNISVYAPSLFSKLFIIHICAFLLLDASAAATHEEFENSSFKFIEQLLLLLKFLT